MKNQFYRTCCVTQGTDEFDAIFHRFERDTGIVVQNDADGNPHSAVVTRLIGIVERMDGQIVLVEPESIRFLDGFASRIIRAFLERTNEYETT